MELLGFRCCSRLSRGGGTFGTFFVSLAWDYPKCTCCTKLIVVSTHISFPGPGAAPPYRLYVDSSVVLMCLLTLGPASPLVAPAALMYFLCCQPLLRRCCIFVYRPKFDGGGLRWPFIFDMIVSSLFVGQILLTLQMVLKQAVGPAIASALPMLPTLLSVMNMKKKFLRSFRDEALLQTSLLDGWDPKSKDWSTMQKREEFRRFLVDAHKAAYVPVCLARTNTNAIDSPEISMTAEPAVVVPLETDIIGDIFLHRHDDFDNGDPHDEADMNSTNHDSTNTYNHHHERHKEHSTPLEIGGTDWDVLEQGNQQYGATLRRAGNTLSALRQRALSLASNASSVRSCSKPLSSVGVSGWMMEMESTTTVDPLSFPNNHMFYPTNNDHDGDDNGSDQFSFFSTESKHKK